MMTIIGPIIAALLVAALVALCCREIWKGHQGGGCAGCGGSCAGCSGCSGDAHHRSDTGSACSHCAHHSAGKDSL